MATASSRRVRSLVLTMGLFSTGGASCILGVSFSLNVMALLTGMVILLSLLVVNRITIRRYKKIVGYSSSHQGTDVGPFHRGYLFQLFVVGTGKQHPDGNLVLSRRIGFTSVHGYLLSNIVTILRFSNHIVKAVMSLFYYQQQG